MYPDNPSTEDDDDNSLKSKIEQQRSGLFKFWLELKSRHVVLVGIVYAVVGGLVTMVASATFAKFDIPVLAYRFVVLLIVLGFPISLVVAWAFELTPDGIKITNYARKEHGDVQVEKSHVKKRNWFSIAITASVPTLIFGIMAVVFYGKFQASEDRHLAGEQSEIIKSIAVLPFVNMSSDKENEYLSDGLTEEILNMLAKVPGLRVPARTSSFVFKGQTDDIKKIGELLRVDTVLEGSVQKSGNQLRVTAQLINVADGYHLWSERYDREMTNIFEIQDDIARTIVNKLELTMGGSAVLESNHHRPENVEAYELYLKGKFHGERWTETDMGLAISYFEEALKVQPDYGLVYTGLARTYGILRFSGFVPPGSVNSQLRAVTAKALELDDSLAEAHARLASNLFWDDWDWDAAEREYKRALELDPRNVETLSDYANLLLVKGRYEEAQAEAIKAQLLDPLSVVMITNLGWVSYFSKDFDRALEAGQKAVFMAPEYFFAHYLLGAVLFYGKGEHEAGITAMEKAANLRPYPSVWGYLGAMYGRMGRKEDARGVLDNLKAMAKEKYVPATPFWLIYDGLEDHEQANFWMKKAIADREANLVYLHVKPDEMTRANPYYDGWIKEIGLDKL